MPTVLPPNLREMRRRFRVEQRVTTQDSYGHSTSTWTPFIATIQGSLTDYVRSMFQEVTNIVQPTSLFDIGIRYRPGITKQMRVVEISTGRTFRILDINNLSSMNQWLVLRCMEFA